MPELRLRFILGRAGTGKTHACLDAVRSALLESPEGYPLILLVPEQATFQVERALVETPGLGGFMRAHVLSFRRLAWRVLAEVGGGTAPLVGSAGKRMLLRSILEANRQALRAFGPAVERPGFLEHLERILSELKAHGRKGADLVTILSPPAGDNSPGAGIPPTVPPGLLAAKLADLAMIDDELEARLRGRLIDPDDYLTMLARSFGASRWARGAAVWVDGFAGFTPQEYEVLRGLARAVSELNVALCLDPRWLNTSGTSDDSGTSGVSVGGRPASCFDPTVETFRRLEELAAEEGIPVNHPVLLGRDGAPHRFRGAPSLAHLERELFSFPGVPYVPFDGSQQGLGESIGLADSGRLEYPVPAPTARPERFARSPQLKLAPCRNRRAEVESAAREILALCRDRGYRFREIGVLTASLDPYRDLLEDVFQARGIPCFIDRRRPVMDHPLVTLVRAALEILATDWAPGPVFRFLKTDLTPLDRDEVDRLENYVLAHGIRGYRSYSGPPWTYVSGLSLDEDGDEPGRETRRELEDINRIRDRAVAVLREFQETFFAGARTGTVSGVAGVTGTAGRAGGAAGAAGAAAGATTGSAGASARTGVTAFAEALDGLLGTLQVDERLQEWSRKAERAGRLEESAGHNQVRAGLTEVLQQAAAALGELELDPESFLDLLDDGLGTLSLGLIPPGLDQVLVGTIDRSRQPDLRAVMVLGVSDRVFPGGIREDLIFTDRDRDRLAALGMGIGPGSRQRLLRAQYLSYIALTRASEYLWISYPLADEEGKPLAPSRLVGRVEELFPGLSSGGEAPDGATGSGTVSTENGACVGVVKLEPGGSGGTGDPVTGLLPEEIAGPSDLASGLQAALTAAREGYPFDPRWLELYQWIAAPAVSDTSLPADIATPSAADGLTTAGSLRDLVERTLRGMGHINHGDPLPPEIVRAFVGDTLKLSVSRLESFAACPFRYFAGSLLGLRERRIYRLEAPDLGQFCHAALKLYADWLRREGLDWGEPTPNLAGRALEDILDRLVRRLQHEILLSSGSHRRLLSGLRRDLSLAVEVLGRHARAGQFRPVAVEVSFGGADVGRSAGQSAGFSACLPPLRLELPPAAGSLFTPGGFPTVELRGRIDRIDLAAGFGGAEGVDGTGGVNGAGEAAGTGGAGDRVYVRVIDYKRSGRPLDLSRLFHGLSLQLPTYLMVAVENAARLGARITVADPHRSAGDSGEAAGDPSEARVIPAGALYFPVHSGLKHRDAPPLPGEAETLPEQRLQATGLLLGDLGAITLMDRAIQERGNSSLLSVKLNQDGSFRKGSSVTRGPGGWKPVFDLVRSRVTRLAEGILTGETSVEPYLLGSKKETPCTYCPYPAVCGFEPGIEGSPRRFLASMGADEFWEAVETGAGSEAAGRGSPGDG